MSSLLGETFSWPLWPDPSGIPPASDETEFVFQDPTAPVPERDITEVFHPRVFAFVPGKPNGRAALVLAGGGYTKLVVGKEGVEVAQWLTSMGFHAFVLVHRFRKALWARGGRNASQPPVDDAIEAMRQIRSRAPELEIDTHGIGVWG